MVVLNASNVKNEDDVQGFDRPLPGRYHVAITDVDESLEKFDKVIVDFEILAGTTPGQEGKRQTEFYACTEKAAPRLLRLALITGVIEGGQNKDVAFSPAIGQELVIELETQKSKTDGKEYTNVSFLGMWSCNNPEVADVKKAAAAGANDGNDYGDL